MKERSNETHEELINNKFALLINSAKEDHGQAGVPLTRVDSAFVMFKSKADDFVIKHKNIDHRLVQWYMKAAQDLLTNMAGGDPKLQQFFAGLVAEIVVKQAKGNKVYRDFMEMVKPYVIIMVTEIDEKQASISSRYIQPYKLCHLFDLMYAYKKYKQQTIINGERLIHVSSMGIDIKKNHMYPFFGEARVKWLSRYGYQLMINESFEWCVSDEVKLLEGFDKHFGEFNPIDPDQPNRLAGVDDIPINFVKLF